MLRAILILGAVTAIFSPAAASAARGAECAPIVIVPGSDDIAGWNQLMSLAACLQDDHLARVRDADDVAPMVEDMTRMLAPTLLMYLAALENGPAPVQLRAAYQIGAANLALVVRARTSLVASDPALRAELEPLLLHAKQTAWIAFAAVAHAADANPAFAVDDVTRTMVRSARELRDALQDVAPADSGWLVAGAAR